MLWLRGGGLRIKNKFEQCFHTNLGMDNKTDLAKPAFRLVNI